PKLIVGPIGTGNRFESDQRRIEGIQREFGAVAIEMEGAAVGYTCFVNDVKFIILRTISDTGGGGATKDFENYLKIASENSFKIVETMLRVISIKDDAASTE
ncbi:MAG: 5'-methylthioadenosine/S-adenosylhomocysteine nucleosidase, partial [candidate division Zixibacteria bacterium]|nr:5'-methylthioadenosine/S-adenosylhomocysteine nucleosidase [candidate division Zixibacteria bacterium]